MNLKDIRVIDFTRFVSGAFCTMVLSNLGAEVIKIESPDGDELRKTGKTNDVTAVNLTYLYLNKNKKSVALDLKNELQHKKAKELIASADIVVENFRPGVMSRLGLDYLSAKKINDKIIYASITGFGTGGPREHEPAFDAIIQAMSGLMFLNGTQDMEPLRTEIPISDISAGLYAAIGILSALYKRETKKEGSEIQISMLDSLTSLFAFSAGNLFATGKNPVRNGNHHPNFAPYGLFESKDFPIYIAPATHNQWRALCECLSLGGLIDNPLFVSNTARTQHRQLLNDLITPKFKTMPGEYWLNALREHDIPCSKVNTLAEGIAEVKANNPEMLIEVKYADQSYSSLGSPIKLAAEKNTKSHCCAQLGENNNDTFL